MNPEQALVLIEEAKEASSLFPGPHSAAVAYRTLMKLVHPDRFPREQRDRAGKATARLNQLYGEMTAKPAGIRAVSPRSVAPSAGE